MGKNDELKAKLASMLGKVLLEKLSAWWQRRKARKAAAALTPKE